jgi:histidine triad (HIT) family protein
MKKFKEDCIFCKIIKKDIPSEIIDEGDNYIVINDINPVSIGHCLIIPKIHYETIFDLPNLMSSELIHLAKRNGLRLINEKKADGIKLVQNNFESAGQVVKHFHLHIIPEKSGKKRNKLV